ncbi:MAG: nucleoside deaminase [Harvfovirus sp.]|uniref:Nucleoside deaminase n=1 Tax=Harvfovirus sp. TaxID=2487768 RepID=A0A3G4ZZV2_9VIRU|nr:MAG: nucleoside deaminase [Harvfovirus sp.]
MATSETKHTFNPEFMKRAIELSRIGSLEKKTGGVYGAVIVKGEKIISEGYNQVVARNDPTWHAEMQAIREASAALGSPHLQGCIMYTSSECCPMCFSAGYWSKLDHIFYASTTEDSLIYGNFADSDIYNELKKSPEDRLLTSSEKMREEAVVVWKEYAKMTDRVHY